MKVWTPADVIRSLAWIREAQDHVNSCVGEFENPDAFEAAFELQRSIDLEWDALGGLVADRPRPFSALGAFRRVTAPEPAISRNWERRLSNCGTKPQGLQIANTEGLPA